MKNLIFKHPMKYLQWRQRGERNTHTHAKSFLLVWASPMKQTVTHQVFLKREKRKQLTPTWIDTRLRPASSSPLWLLYLVPKVGFAWSLRSPHLELLCLFCDCHCCCCCLCFDSPCSSHPWGDQRAREWGKPACTALIQLILRGPFISS